MSYRKFFLFVPLLLTLVLSGCHSSAPSKSGAGSAVNNSSDKDSGITALAAWQKVKNEVDKWDSHAQLVKIKDSSYASFQRRDGLADVWEFVVDQCQAKNERHNYCNKGKSRTYFYSTTKGGWGPKGVSSRQEGSSSYSVPIDLSRLKIDTDQAVKLARQKTGHSANKYEEFIINTYTLENGTVYWKLRRQCWSKRPDRQACSSDDSYTAYVNTESGEVLNKSPRN